MMTILVVLSACEPYKRLEKNYECRLKFIEEGFNKQRREWETEKVIYQNHMKTLEQMRQEALAYAKPNAVYQAGQRSFWRDIFDAGRGCLSAYLEWQRTFHPIAPQQAG
jgi:hypothetical protein